MKFPGTYFTGDSALRDEVGYYRITGKVDDVIIVSGHNMGTAPIEDVINEHQFVAESAIVGYPRIAGQSVISSEEIERPMDPGHTDADGILLGTVDGDYLRLW